MLGMLKLDALVRPEYVEPPAIVDYKITLEANGGTSPIASMTIASNSEYTAIPFEIKRSLLIKIFHRLRCRP